MYFMTIALNKFIDPDPKDIGNDIYEFLEFLGGPSEIFLTGENTCRTRAFVTLLHGNEPSGTMALFKWLKSGHRPAVNIVCIVASVEAARIEPTFSQRILAGQRDLNRCFKPPYEDEAGKLARAILDRLEEVEPEALIDMHNTSGTGPSFGVAIYMDQQHDALTALFTQRLIVTHLRLGALMEVTEYLCPTVTVECGGRLDDSAHEIAWRGLKAYFGHEQVLSSGPHDWGLEILTNPVRLEIQSPVSLCFADEPSPEHDLTLLPSIEHFNAGVTKADTQLGWIKQPELDTAFQSKNSTQACVVNELVYANQGALYTKRDLKLFMITTNPSIAKMDCLLYAVKSDGDELIPEVNE